MPTRRKVTEATFEGIRNGRPVFDFGDDTAPPDWLLKLASGGKVDGDRFLVDGKALQPGQKVTGD